MISSLYPSVHFVSSPSTCSPTSLSHQCQTSPSLDLCPLHFYNCTTLCCFSASAASQYIQVHLSFLDGHGKTILSDDVFISRSLNISWMFFFPPAAAKPIQYVVGPSVCCWQAVKVILLTPYLISRSKRWSLILLFYLGVFVLHEMRHDFTRRKNTSFTRKVRMNHWILYLTSSWRSARCVTPSCEY